MIGDDDRLPRKLRLRERIAADRRAVLVVNTRARRGAQAYRRAKRLLTEGGVTLDAAFPVRDPARLPEIVGGLIDAGHALVVVGGGDGTLSSVVDLFAGRDAVLGVLPLGTANSFAAGIGLPMNLEGAVAVIASGKVADIDLAQIDGDYFINSASIGLAAAIARGTPHGLKRRLGRLSYALVGAAKLSAHRSFRLDVVTAEGSRSFEALQVVLAKGRYFGGVLAARDAGPETRRVHIQIVVGRTLWRLVRAWWRLARGVAPGPDLVEEVVVREARIEATPPQYVSIDGEVAARTPIRVRVVEEALLVMAPAEFEDED